MSKQKFSNAAQEIFKAHKNLKEVYVTSDGQGFTSENKAEDHSRVLKDKDVEHYENSNLETNDGSNDGTAERSELVQKYKDLFEKEPAHNMKTETIAAKIEEKQAELANQEK